MTAAATIRHPARTLLERGITVVSENPKVSRDDVEEALYLMAASYEKLGLSTLQADAERVLKQNFPNSKYYTEGLDKKKPWWRLWW